MSSRQWLDNHWLIRHATSREEIRALFELADRDLSDCKAPRLSDDWPFGIAYNAALQVATAALCAAGYKPARGQSHHLRAFQSLAFTLKPEKNVVDQLDAFRAKRHAGIYDAAGSVSSSDAAAMIALAEDLRKQVLDWLRKNYAKLAQ